MNKPNATAAETTLDQDAQRLAALIAEGQVPFPITRSKSEQMALAQRVADLRRQRLLKLIAHAIARDMYAEHEQEAQEEHHVKKSV